MTSGEGPRIIEASIFTFSLMEEKMRNRINALDWPIALLFISFFWPLPVGAVPRPVIVLPPQGAGACQKGESYGHFDFWLGDWEARDRTEKGPVVGTSRIEKISGGCVVQENWESPGFTGKSWNFYDASLGKWRQIWIDFTGRKAEFAGVYREDAMRFEGETVRADGVRFKSRMTFFNLGPDKVRQLAERSTDGGQTWTTTVDYLYLRKK